MNPFRSYGEARSPARRSEQEFRRLIDEAKERYNLSDLVARTRRIHRAGNEKVALCAFHNERTPSMRVSDAKGTFHCFGCGASGDLVTYVMETEGRGFMDALRWLGAAGLPPVNPSDRARALEEDVGERTVAIAEAQAIWARSVAAAGTPAEVYARSRGIVAPLPPAIRFVETYAWRDRETGETGPDLPAMICAVTLADTTIIGLQRIFLARGGRTKATFRNGKAKRSIGRIKGGAARLGDPASRTIIITEGPEDALSLAQEFPDREVYASLGTALMPAIDYPDEVGEIVIAGQNDAAGRTAVEAAALQLVERGIAVRTMWPRPEFKDWNDQLLGRCR